MTRRESIALWRILSVLAGLDEIIDVAEIDADLGLLLDHMPDAITDDFDLGDYEQMLDSLRAQIELNLTDHLPSVVAVGDDHAAALTGDREAL